MQRRVADLKAAGLSPVLAAGSSAQAGSPTVIDPIQSKDAFGAEGMMAGATKAAQTQQSVVAADAARAQINLIKAQTIKTGAEAAAAASEAALYHQPGGHSKYQDVWGKRLTEIMNVAKDYMNSNRPTDAERAAINSRTGGRPGDRVPQWRIYEQREDPRFRNKK